MFDSTFRFFVTSFVAMRAFRRALNIFLELFILVILLILIFVFALAHLSIDSFAQQESVRTQNRRALVEMEHAQASQEPQFRLPRHEDRNDLRAAPPAAPRVSWNLLLLSSSEYPLSFSSFQAFPG